MEKLRSSENEADKGTKTKIYIKSRIRRYTRVLESKSPSPDRRTHHISKVSGRQNQIHKWKPVFRIAEQKSAPNRKQSFERGNHQNIMLRKCSGNWRVHVGSPCIKLLACPDSRPSRALTRPAHLFMLISN